MQYYSTRNKNLRVSLREAVFSGLAEDGGLFMPERIPVMGKDFFSKIEEMDFPELSYHIALALFGEDMHDEEIRNLVFDALNFETPLINLDDKLSVLELFHGPTLAFKDVGARFTARMLQILVKKHPDEIHVLVATSGDTGSAVANGFLGVEGIKVHVLYPRNKVSKIQEMQFTTLGRNIAALEVDGSFDDCQKLVKQAFSDKSIREKLSLTSANSINLARLLPQSFYYFNACRQVSEKENLVFCVPSGNFGNLTAGLIARKMGLPVKHFIAATNVNDVFPNYLLSGEYKPRPSKATIANAMDVGDPSNFDRMTDLYKNSVTDMRKDITSYSFRDEEIQNGIKNCFQKLNYITDPHGATGYLASCKHLAKYQNDHVVFLETAHPAKFGSIVKESAGIEPEIPERLRRFLDGKKEVVPVKNSFTDFKNYLFSQITG